MEKGPKSRRMSVLATVPFAAAALLASPAATSADEAAAQELVRQNKCTKCHSVDKAKSGPAFKEIAAKYKGNKEAEAKLMKHLGGSGKIKLKDGREEDHAAVKAKSPEETKNLVSWILSL